MQSRKEIPVGVFFSALIAVAHSTSPAERNGRANLFSFRSMGQDVELGLDFEVPFIKVPMKQYKDEFGNNAALVNINIASLIASGLLAGGSLIVAHTLRSLNLFQQRSVEGDLEQMQEESVSDEGERRKDFKKTGTKKDRSLYAEDYLYDSKGLFDHFKLVYKNNASERVETTLPSLLAHIADTLSENEVDIGACLQKSICLMLRKSSKNVRQGEATGVEKIVDGVSSLTWLLDALGPYKELKAIINASKTETGASCALAYPSCGWSVPETRLAELIRTYVNFV